MPICITKGQSRADLDATGREVRMIMYKKCHENAVS